MTKRTWFILGATSIIAEEFSHLAAQAGAHVVLVGRNIQQLEIIAADIRLRHHVDCDFLPVDFTTDWTALLSFLVQNPHEVDLFIAHSVIYQNSELTTNAIEELVDTNILSTVQLINAYLQKPQAKHRLIFLSSVAACRGRAKNSLYGSSKAAIEVYLQGLQQAAGGNLTITIARLGFIDTNQTYGIPGIFYAASPKSCANACWQALKTGKRLIYYPFFWRFIMAIITRMPFFIYKRMKF
ncbi:MULTISPECIES: SDR family NAD(P)-dependent oxidoreductase [unclassified Legionella]|uniref:SDR family NAD(P)-dependent oxidoreductase n=1 Tax=unclassified Legionella TaxID=2622702 RepID=UPI001054BFE0|nr:MULTISPECIES: SDR family NAD(P)-dependent oxidoreductase [unclassified Legionella]MDI9817628.1 SDR family NAD(P)-dependent oxidoreductase [Legionella sp. PL877]